VTCVCVAGDEAKVCVVCEHFGEKCVLVCSQLACSSSVGDSH
jgi:CMP-2-keto-3-deoxyoctulosonic acid synthetase